MKSNKHVAVFIKLILILLGGFTMSCNEIEVKPKWRQLFNGKDLAGWKIKFSGYQLGDNFNNTFSVSDGILKVNYDNYDSFNGEFGHIFYDEIFSDYKLRVEYRFTGEQTDGGPGWAYRNSGAMLHCQSPQSMELDQDFPVSIEAQFLGGNGVDDRPTGNVCTPGTNIYIDSVLVRDHCINSASKTYHGDQWVTMTVEVRGDSIIEHFVNDELVIEYTNPVLDESDEFAQSLIKKNGAVKLQKGYIALQAESHAIEFRKVEILELK